MIFKVAKRSITISDQDLDFILSLGELKTKGDNIVTLKGEKVYQLLGKHLGLPDPIIFKNRDHTDLRRSNLDFRRTLANKRNG